MEQNFGEERSDPTDRTPENMISYVSQYDEVAGQCSRKDVVDL